MIFEPQASHMDYLGALIGAGLEGIASARHERNNRVLVQPATPDLWRVTVAGAVIGALSARLFGKRKSVQAAAMGGVVGSIAGCGAAVAWASRGFLVPAGRCAAERVNAVRNAHWLAMNPIDYA